MIDPSVAILVGSALLLGVASSLHCVAMCGPLAVIARGGVAWHLGRLLSYFALGTLAGLAGGAVGSAGAGRWLPIGVAAFCSLILAVSALQLGDWLPRAGRGGGGAGGFGRLLGRLLRHLATQDGRGLRVRRFVLGLANGLIPCGAVYAGLAVAAASGGTATGGLTMVAFGMGTVPSTAIAGLSLGRLGGRSPTLRRTVAVAALALGLATIWYRTPIAPSQADTADVPACHEPRGP